MDKPYLWMKKKDELFYEHVQQTFFCKKLKKKNRVETIYVGLFWKIRPMKCSNHTSSHTSYFIWNIFKFYIIYTI